MSEAARPTLTAQTKRYRTPRLMWVVMALVAATVGVLVFMLAQTTKNKDYYDSNYTVLIAINAAVAMVLFLSVLWAIARIYQRVRQGKFGSQLLMKLALVFMLVGVAPGAMIYLVSYQFVARSIESWFDVEVESALDSGVLISQRSLEVFQRDAENKLQSARDELAAQGEEVVNVAMDKRLESLRKRYGFQSLAWWTLAPSQTAGAIASDPALPPEWVKKLKPSADILQRIHTLPLVSSIEGLDNSDSGRAKSLAPPSNQAQEPAWVQVLIRGPQSDSALHATYLLDAEIARHALNLQRAYTEYQERSLAREGLRRMYIGTLSLTFFLAVFLAVLMAFVLGRQLVEPLLLLAHGVKQVSQGDLGPKPTLDRTDEVASLANAFALMTQQLAEARNSADVHMHLLGQAKSQLQTVVDNVTAGIMVMDADHRVKLYNPGAGQILRLSEQHKRDCVGLRLSEIDNIQKFAAVVEKGFSDWQREQAEFGKEHYPSHWQKTVDFEQQDFGSAGPKSQTSMATELIGITGNPAVEEPPLVLILRGAQLPGGERLLVFDDISDIVSAQRTQAWAEVARRLAHEIKNPLTPIQLSAERIQHKLQAKLDEASQHLLVKSVRTIVDQVETMKRLVNEFRDFGRLPRAALKPVDLNLLIMEILQLYEADVRQHIEGELSPSIPLVMADAEQLRQVIHNLIQNAQDACETAPQPLVKIATASNEKRDRVKLMISDNGPGFADKILKMAFEPYITTKEKGTGLGLVIVKKIADEHHARIELSNIRREVVEDGIIREKVLGAKVTLSLMAVKTDEK